ncbi:MAG: amidase family protein [Candidatus Hodgkinia cicadicola]
MDLRLILALVSRIERTNWYFKIGSGGTLERALSNKRVKARLRKRALTGFSVSIKELFLLKNGFTEASSMILSRFVSAYDSETVIKLKRAGASLVLKTNMDEFGIGYTGDACAHGYIISAWARALPPTKELIASGGSSGGSANAVAMRISTIALATDTGGSVRQPASYAGVIGLKPSYGRCSRWGVLAYASSLDQVGVLARSAINLARVCANAFGVDFKDNTSASLPVPKYELYFRLKAAPAATALVLRQHMPRVAGAWVYSLAALTRAGLQLAEAHAPFVNIVVPCYSVLTSVECYSNLAKYNGIKFGLRFKEINPFLLYKKLRTAVYSLEVKRKLLTGAYVLSTRLGYERYYLKAQRLRFIIKSCLLSRLRNRNVLASPTVSISKLSAERVGAPAALADIYTVLANLTGLPSVNVPTCLGHEGVPFGIQLVAGAHDELKLITLSAELARACGVLSLCR